MLAPLTAFVPGPAEALTSADAAAAARSIRDAPGPARERLDAAVERGLFRRNEGLHRYTIDGPSGRLVAGLVGIAPLEKLIPHEDTYASAVGGKPDPPVEIRPLLAICEGVLPELSPTGASSVVRYGRLVHTVTPVGVPGTLELGTMVVADGHHRRAVALRERGKSAAGMTLVVGSGGRGLTAGSFQWRLPGVGPLPPRVTEHFDVEAAARPSPRVAGPVWATSEGDASLLRPRPEAMDLLAAPMRPIAAAVAVHLLYPLLGRMADRPVPFATAKGAVSALDHGDAAVLLARARASDVMAAARAGCLLPAKSTRFRPKPVRGLIMRCV